MKSRVYKKPWMGETHQSHYGWAQEHNKQAAQKLTLESQKITLFLRDIRIGKYTINIWNQLSLLKSYTDLVHCALCMLDNIIIEYSTVLNKTELHYTKQ